MPEEGEEINPENEIPTETSDQRMERKVREWAKHRREERARKKEPVEI